MTKKTLKIIHDLKKKKQGITSLTSYDASFAKLADQCGVDILLIGDSLGEVIKGDKNTHSVTMNEMIYHTKNVASGSNHAYLIADLPKHSFDNNKIALCDRENFRVQIFDFDGNYLDQWHFHRPIAIYSDQYTKEIYVAEAGAPDVQSGVPNLGLRVVIVNENGEKITSFGKGTLGENPDQFIGPHGMAVDSEGSVYIAEVSYTAFGSNQDPPREVASLRKWERNN